MVGLDSNLYLGNKFSGLLLIGDLERFLIEYKCDFGTFERCLELPKGGLINFESFDYVDGVNYKFFVTKIN